MKKIPTLLLLVTLLTLNVYADSGSRHIIKAKVKTTDKEFIGYFLVLGYLYLEKDSLNSWTKNVDSFTKRAKTWIYGDSLNLYSEIIELKEFELTIYPTDRLNSIDKKDIKEIFPLELISPSRHWCNSKVKSADKAWVLKDIIKKDSFGVVGGADCLYVVLYYNNADKKTIDLVKSLENELKEETKGENRGQNINKLLKRLTDLQVIVYSECST